jgi:hypothetical protein
VRTGGFGGSSANSGRWLNDHPHSWFPRLQAVVVSD